MAEKQLTEQEWDRLVRNFFKELARSATRGRGGAQKLADAIGLSKQAISDLRGGRSVGRVVSNVRMLFYKAGIPDADAKKFLQNPNIVIKGLDSPSPVDSLVEELKNVYSENELLAWFRLLLSKKVVENEVGVGLKAFTKKKSSRKKPSKS